MTLFPGAIETKPDSATIPFFGIKPTILDPVSGKVLKLLRFLDLFSWCSTGTGG
jgi:hypothetical protein